MLIKPLEYMVNAYRNDRLMVHAMEFYALRINIELMEIFDCYIIYN